MTHWATKDSFDATTGVMLKKYFQDWYAPNNAILVIAGDVDPAATLARVKQWYGPIKQRPIPAHPEIHLPSVKADSFTLDSNLLYELVFVAFRMPGTSSPDFAATRILSDVVGSQRADLYGLVPLGKALGTDFGLAETYPKNQHQFCACRSGARNRSGANYRRDEDHSPKLREYQTGANGSYLKQQLQDKIIEHRRYTNEHGVDMPEVRSWKWSNPK